MLKKIYLLVAERLDVKIEQTRVQTKKALFRIIIMSNIERNSELCVTLAYTTVPYSDLSHIYNPRHIQKSVKHVR